MLDSHRPMIYAPAVTSTQPGQATAELTELADQLEVRRDDVAAAMQELAGLLVTDETLETTLQRIAELAVRTLPDCHAAGVTLVAGNTYVTAAWTDGCTISVDKAQYDDGDGPCLEALRTQRIVRTGREGAKLRWPNFARAAESEQVCSFLAAPLPLRGESIGALNLYSRHDHGFEELDDALICMFAGQATVALANAKVYRDALQLSEQLREAIDSRAVIEQAKGILMARHGVDSEAAFRMLRDDSQNRNVKLRLIAGEIVASVSGLPVPTAPET